MKRYDLERPAAHERGYHAQWRKVRAEVLRAARIPESEWCDYDVDHEPRYPLLGPDHYLYRLTRSGGLYIPRRRYVRRTGE